MYVLSQHCAHVPFLTRHPSGRWCFFLAYALTAGRKPAAPPVNGSHAAVSSGGGGEVTATLGHPVTELLPPEGAPLLDRGGAKPAQGGARPSPPPEEGSGSGTERTSPPPENGAAAELRV